MNNIPSGTFEFISTITGLIGRLSNARAMAPAPCGRGSWTENFVPKADGKVAFNPSSVVHIKAVPRTSPICSAKILASISVGWTVILTPHLSLIKRQLYKAATMASFCSGVILLGCILASSSKFALRSSSTCFLSPAARTFASAACFPICAASHNEDGSAISSKPTPKATIVTNSLSNKRSLRLANFQPTILRRARTGLIFPSRERRIRQDAPSFWSPALTCFGSLLSNIHNSPAHPTATSMAPNRSSQPQSPNTERARMTALKVEMVCMAVSGLLLLIPLVPMEGVEPTQPYGYQILSLARLPIPPHRPSGAGEYRAVRAGVNKKII